MLCVLWSARIYTTVMKAKSCDVILEGIVCSVDPDLSAFFITTYNVGISRISISSTIYSSNQTEFQHCFSCSCWNKYACSSSTVSFTLYSAAFLWMRYEHNSGLCVLFILRAELHTTYAEVDLFAAKHDYMWETTFFCITALATPKIPNHSNL